MSSAAKGPGAHRKQRPSGKLSDRYRETRHGNGEGVRGRGGDGGGWEQQEERQRERGITSNYPRLVALWSPARKTVQLQMTPLTGAACLTTRRRKGGKGNQPRPRIIVNGSTSKEGLVGGGRLPSSFLTPCVRTCSTGRVPRATLA